MTNKPKSIQQVLREAHDYIQKYHGVSLDIVDYRGKLNVSTLSKIQYVVNNVEFTAITTEDVDYD